MNRMKPTGSVFCFEPKDTCIKECRPLVDPLPPFMEAKSAKKPQHYIPRSIGSSSRCSGGSLEVETPSEACFWLLKTEGMMKNPAGSPSFARRPIANGHFQLENFKPSIRINQPPGGIDQIGL